MKRNIFLAVFTACIVSAVLIQSCDPLESPTYSQTFFRIATVNVTDGKPSLYTDFKHETFYLKNIKTESDLSGIGLTNNQHIIAMLTIDAVGTMSNNTITLNAFADLDTTRCVGQKPSDTLNYFYYFAPYDFDRMAKDSVYPSYIYPRVWAEGHVIYTSATYYVSNEKEKAEFFLYPFDVQGDTLMMRLYSDIPECDARLYPYVYFQKVLSLDISSIRKSADNPTEQIIRDTILARLDRLNQDKITVRVVTPDILRAKNSMNPNDSIKRGSQPPITIKIPFDF